MKELLLQFAQYNQWANKRMIDAIAALPAEACQQQLASSFPSLTSTILHLWDAEAIWWQRLKLSERLEIPSESFSGGFTDAASGLAQQDKIWVEWIEAALERALEHEFIYQNSKREQFKQPVYQMLLHLFNHGTYHRGQLVTMLHQCGVEKIPSTDFIVFSRKK